MCDNKSFRSIVAICVGCAYIFSTACSKYSSKFAVTGNAGYNSTSKMNGPLDVRQYERYKEELNRAVYNLDGINLIELDNCKMTLLCKAIQINRLDLLRAFLGYIKDKDKKDKDKKDKDKKYPEWKVVDLIANYDMRIGSYPPFKMTLLSRAVRVGNVHMLKLLFDTLVYYDQKYTLGVCRSAFDRKLSIGKADPKLKGETCSLIHVAVEAMNLTMLTQLLSWHPLIDNPSLPPRYPLNLSWHPLIDNPSLPPRYPLNYYFVNHLATSSEEPCVKCPMLGALNGRGETALDSAIRQYFECNNSSKIKMKEIIEVLLYEKYFCSRCMSDLRQDNQDNDIHSMLRSLINQRQKEYQKKKMLKEKRAKRKMQDIDSYEKPPTQFRPPMPNPIPKPTNQRRLSKSGSPGKGTRQCQILKQNAQKMRKGKKIITQASKR